MTTHTMPFPVAQASSRASTRMAYILSGLLAVVTLIAPAAGFFSTDLFARDNAALAGCARGTALVMLVVALPILLIAMFLSARGSARARLAWLGMLTYIFYNSFYFTFSATFNRFTPAFLAMLGLAGWSLLALLIATEPRAIQKAYAASAAARPFSIYLLFPVLIFLITDLREVLTASLSGGLPPSILNTQMPTNHFHIVDLAFLVPAFLLAAAWLWQRRDWGYVLAGMLSAYYTIELLGIGVDQYFGGRADPTSPLADASAMPVFLGLAAVSLIVTVLYYRNVRGEGRAG